MGTVYSIAWDHSVDLLQKNSVRTKFTNVNPFCLKESLVVKALITLGHPPILPWCTLPSLVTIGGKLKEFVNNETHVQFSYLDLFNMAVIR